MKVTYNQLIEDIEWYRPSEEKIYYSEKDRLVKETRDEAVNDAIDEIIYHLRALSAADIIIMN